MQFEEGRSCFKSVFDRVLWLVEVKDMCCHFLNLPVLTHDSAIISCARGKKVNAQI